MAHVGDEVAPDVGHVTGLGHVTHQPVQFADQPAVDQIATAHAYPPALARQLGEFLALTGGIDVVAAVLAKAGMDHGDVDLVDLRRAPGLLQHQAGTHGRALYEDQPGRFNVYRVLAWRLYLDEAYQCRRHDARYIREGLERLQR